MNTLTQKNISNRTKLTKIRKHKFVKKAWINEIDCIVIELDPYTDDMVFLPTIYTLRNGLPMRLVGKYICHPTNLDASEFLDILESIVSTKEYYKKAAEIKSLNPHLFN